MAKRKLWHSLLSTPNQITEQRSGITFDQWASMFNTPFTSWGPQQDVEEVVQALGGAVKANGPTFALVQARAMVFSEARFLWRRFDNGRPQDLFWNQDLQPLDRPWPGGTTGDLLARMEFDASRAGNAYVRRVRSDLLNVMNPEWVMIILGSNEDADNPQEASDVTVVGYIYDPPNGRRLFLEPHEVAHYAPIPDPDFRFLGMSWITPVLEDVLGDQSGAVHKNEFFKHAATPNLILKFPEGMKRRQIEEYAKLIDARHAGAENSYKTMYLGGGADPITVGRDFRQMDFAVTQGKGESRLAAASGVPPSWVGFSEGLQGSALNAGNFTAARRRFADGTMRPLWRNAAASLETILKSPGGSAQLWYDTRDIAFLREDKQVAAEIQGREAATIVNLVRDGFTPDSVVSAVKNNDWSLLVFDERFISVQLQSLEDPENVIEDDEDDDEANSSAPPARKRRRRKHA
jgi:phage portal protein BeeE